MTRVAKMATLAARALAPKAQARARTKARTRARTRARTTASRSGRIHIGKTRARTGGGTTGTVGKRNLGRATTKARRTITAKVTAKAPARATARVPARLAKAAVGTRGGMTTTMVSRSRRWQ